MPTRPSPALRAAVSVALSTLAALAAPLALASMPSHEWRFTALLDDRPIGTHRFVLAHADGSPARLESEARFDVTILGVSVYRYRHRSSERWEGGCLTGIDARTDDDGRVTTVRGREAAGGGLALERRAGDVEDAAAQHATTTPACLMTFAYWHPALPTQTRLLDPGTGRIEPVTITPLPESTLDVEGRSTAVRGLRIAGLPRPIDVWYAGARWVGLDTTVAGGRRLSYRLR